MPQIRRSFPKLMLLALLSWGLLLIWGVGYSFSESKSGCLICHTDVRMLKKTLAKEEKKESASIAGMG